MRRAVRKKRKSVSFRWLDSEKKLASNPEFVKYVEIVGRDGQKELHHWRWTMIGVIGSSRGLVV